MNLEKEMISSFVKKIFCSAVFLLCLECTVNDVGANARPGTREQKSQGKCLK